MRIKTIFCAWGIPFTIHSCCRRQASQAAQRSRLRRFCSIPCPVSQRTRNAAKVRLRATRCAQDDTRGICFPRATQPAGIYQCICRREIFEGKAHRRKQGDGDLAIGEPLPGSNAAGGNLSMHLPQRNFRGQGAPQKARRRRSCDRRAAFEEQRSHRKFINGKEKDEAVCQKAHRLVL